MTKIRELEARRWKLVVSGEFVCCVRCLMRIVLENRPAIGWCVLEQCKVRETEVR